MDEHSTVDQKYEIYGENAPYYTGEPWKETIPPDSAVAGDGSPLDASTPVAVKRERSRKGRRKKVSIVRQHWRHLQPFDRDVGPFSRPDNILFDTGHGTAN